MAESGHRAAATPPTLRTSGWYETGGDDPVARLRARQSAPPSARPEHLAQVLSVKFANLGALGVAVLVADSAGLVVEMNPIAEALTGWSLEEARGKLLDTVFEIQAADDELHGPLSLGAAAFFSGGASGSQPLLVHRKGHRRAVTYSLEQVGEQILVLAQDITEQRLNALRLMHLSGHDALTGLMNRAQFIRQCEQALVAAREDRPGGVILFVDIDQFRLINDASGLEAGDSLLAWIAAALREGLGRNDAAGRLGGNEFGLLLRDSTLKDAEQSALRLQDRLRRFRFAWRETTFSVRSSIGVVPIGAEFESASALLGAVESASTEAKKRGGNQVFVWRDHEEAIEVARRNAVSWVARIKDNLRRGRVQLYCQPIVPLGSLAPEGESFEILFRMIGADGVARGPQDVVLMAERYGLMDAIDRWVIENTLRELARDRQRLDGIDHCSINLSATSLRGDSLIDVIRSALSANRVPPSKICFEITETAAVDNLGEVRWLMDQLRSIGCRFSLDDFGTGMASYAYLRDLAVDYIKIDRSFVKDMDSNELSSVIIESIHQIGGLLGARTVAEGVETSAIASALTALGIDFAQGYFFAKPGPLSR